MIQQLIHAHAGVIQLLFLNIYIFLIGEGFNKHALPIIITKSWEVQFSIRFWLMFHRRFANATHIPLRESNRQKLENMKFEPNNTHIEHASNKIWQLENFMHLRIVLLPASPWTRTCILSYCTFRNMSINICLAKVLLFQVSTSVETALDSRLRGTFVQCADCNTTNEEMNSSVM
jgi:hypothetical protein